MPSQKRVVQKTMYIILGKVLLSGHYTLVTNGEGQVPRCKALAEGPSLA